MMSVVGNRSIYRSTHFMHDLRTQLKNHDQMIFYVAKAFQPLKFDNS